MSFLPTASRRQRRFVSVLIPLGIFLLSVVSVRGALGATPGQATAREQALAPAQGVPADAWSCAPTAVRTVAPHVIEAGETFHSEVAYHIACPEGSRRLAMMIAVENTELLSGSGFMGRQLTGNVHDGLANFVEALDFTTGSMGGLILYGPSATVHTKLGEGTSGKQALKSAVSNFAVSGGRNASGVVSAVELGVQAVTAPEVPTDTYRLIMIMDAGGTLGSEEDAQAACDAARDAGVHVAVYALDAAGDRLRGCADENLYGGSSRGGGQDIPDELTDFGTGMTKGDQIRSLSIGDTLSFQLDYVAGSASPAEPFEFSHELTWDVTPGGPTEDAVYGYDVELDPALDDMSGPFSQRADVSFTYWDNRVFNVALDLPEVCVYATGHPEDCAEFVPTATPTATPKEPTATETPEATATPTEEPSATASPTGGDVFTIFLPALKRA